MSRTSDRKKQPTKRLYTLKQAAEYLGQTDWGMRELVWKGVIPAIQLVPRGKIFVDVQDMDEFIERNKAKAL